MQNAAAPTVEFGYVPVFGSSFEVPVRYDNLVPERFESSNIVCSAEDHLTQKPVAIKQVVKPFGRRDVAQNTFQELKLMKYLRHENVAGLCDVFVSPEYNLYFVTESQGMTLREFFKTSGPADYCANLLFYQILRGLKYIHSANVVHCNLSPSSVIIDSHNDVRITDFGKARIGGTEMLQFNVTRYTCAPEVILHPREYDSAIDMWSAGCILAEMLDGQPLFSAKGNRVNWLCDIAKVLGKADSMVDIKNKELTGRLPDMKQQSLAVKFKAAEPNAVDLLGHLLTFEPNERYDARQALCHKFVASCSDPADEPTSDHKWSASDFEYDSWPVDVWGNLVLSEVLDYHDQVFETTTPD